MKKVQQHWDNIYTYKQPAEVSWTQDIPQISLDFIHSFKIYRSKFSVLQLHGKSQDE
ncbi:MAG: hypothetical protein WKF68_06785 [Daejeonella sp.]